MLKQNRFAGLSRRRVFKPWIVSLVLAFTLLLTITSAQAATFQLMVDRSSKVSSGCRPTSEQLISHNVQVEMIELMGKECTKNMIESAEKGILSENAYLPKACEGINKRQSITSQIGQHEKAGPTEEELLLYYAACLMNNRFECYQRLETLDKSMKNETDSTLSSYEACEPRLRTVLKYINREIQIECVADGENARILRLMGEDFKAMGYETEVVTRLKSLIEADKIEQQKHYVDRVGSRWMVKTASQ